MDSILSDAEKKIADIERRIGIIESGGSEPVQGGAPGEIDAALTAYQQVILERLKVIRDKIAAEGDFDAMKRERDNAITENQNMKKEIMKLNYRVKHLVKALNHEEKNNSL